MGAFILLSVTLSAVAIGIMTRFDELQHSKFIHDEVVENKRRHSQILRAMGEGEDEERLGKIRDIIKYLWTGWRKRRLEDVTYEEAAELGVFLTFTNSLQYYIHLFSFRIFIISVTLLGVTTELLVDSSYPEIFYIKLAVQVVLSIDLLLRLLLHTPYSIHFFTSTWRVCDMLTIVFLWFPIIGTDPSYKIVEFLYFSRLFLSITYFFFIEELASVTLAILESSMPFLYVTFLVCVFFYFFGISGVMLFKEADPYHWGSLSSGICTLLQLMTMDGWTGIARNAMFGCANFGYITGFPEYDGCK